MAKLLKILNTASLDELLGTLGVQDETATRIIAARPFASLEECVNAGLLTPEDLEHLESKLPVTKKISSEPEVVNQTKGEDAPVLPTEAQPRSTQKASRFLIRVLIGALILTAVGTATYFGVPLFVEKILTPLETNTSRVSEIANDQKTDVKRLEGEIAALQERAKTLEARATGIDDSITAHTAALQVLEDLQTSLQNNLDAQKVELTAQVNEQLTLTRAIELLSRSRLYLSQNNYGLARQDVEGAHALLTNLLSTIQADRLTGLKVVLNRLEMALNNLPAYPVIAVYDVDTAWQMLVDGLPNVPPVAVTPMIIETVVTPAFTPTPEPTTIP